MSNIHRVAVRPPHLHKQPLTDTHTVVLVFMFCNEGQCQGDVHRVVVTRVHSATSPPRRHHVSHRSRDRLVCFVSPCPG